MELKGRSAIITGANQGLGKAIATSFVRAGASLLLVARGEEKLQATQQELEPLAIQPGQVVRTACGDVSDPVNCAAIMRQAQAVLSNITILVNNAGVYGPMGLIEDISWEAWIEAIQINLFGTVLMCREVIPLMRAQGYGKIVNLSGGGATAPLPRISAYAAAKAAIVRLTETFALELGDTHIDINAIAPGALNTRLLDEVLAAGHEKVGQDFYDRAVKQRDAGGVPLEKGAALAVFLASAASDGITGRLLSAVWDDWVNLPERRDQLAQSDIYTLRRIVPEDRELKW